MEYAYLGKTDISVSRICMGCMGFGNPKTGKHSWTVTADTAAQIIHHGMDLGINFFDTAPGYQSGAS